MKPVFCDKPRKSAMTGFFMKTDAIPGIQRGKYPVKALYVLPGKGVTSTYKLNAEIKQK